MLAVDTLVSPPPLAGAVVAGGDRSEPVALLPARQAKAHASGATMESAAVVIARLEAVRAHGTVAVDRARHGHPRRLARDQKLADKADLKLAEAQAAAALDNLPGGVDITA